MKRFLPFITFLSISILFGATAPQYSVINVPAPPTKFKGIKLMASPFYRMESWSFACQVGKSFSRFKN